MSSNLETKVDVKEDASVGRPAHSRLSRLGRPALVLAACAVLAVGGYYAWQTWFAEDGSTNALLTAVVTRGNLEDAVTATGTLQPKEFVDVGTQVSGQLKRLLVDIGAVVKAGQLLAEIDPSVYQAKVDGDQAQLLNQRALRANLFRTVLTLLGIVIGVASVIAMLAIGDGAKQIVLDRISAMGTNLLLIRPGQPNRRGVGGTVASLVPADADMIAELPNVLAAVPELGGSVTARFGNSDYQTQATGTSATFPVARNWPVNRGIFFRRQT